MPAIEFTQFMRPNGRQVPVKIERPDEIAAMAERLKGAGWRFEVEVLMSGIVSFEICRVDLDGEHVTLVSELCDNGPGVPEVVDRLVRTAIEQEGYLPA